jgi:hypothetical protein
MISSVYGGSAAEISSSDTNAAMFMRYFPKISGEAPGRRFTTAVVFAFEQALSAGSMVVIFSSTP